MEKTIEELRFSDDQRDSIVRAMQRESETLEYFTWGRQYFKDNKEVLAIFDKIKSQKEEHLQFLAEILSKFGVPTEPEDELTTEELHEMLDTPIGEETILDRED